MTWQEARVAPTHRFFDGAFILTTLRFSELFSSVRRVSVRVFVNEGIHTLVLDSTNRCLMDFCFARNASHS